MICNERGSLTETKIFHGIQLLRYVAAVLVVITHATGTYSEKILALGGGHYWFMGQCGVDIFFVISGFVMAGTVTRLSGHPYAYREFSLRRVVRVVPLYWLALSLKIALALALPYLVSHSKIEIPYLLRNFFFVPVKNNDDAYLPVLTVDWAIIYEMFFYLVILISLFLKLSLLKYVSLTFVSTAGLFFLNNSSDWTVLNYFTNPVILEFCFGVSAYHLVDKYQFSWSRLTTYLVLLWLYCLWLSDLQTLRYRFIPWDCAAFLIVLGVALAESWFRTGFARQSCKLGDASYSLYLFHPFLVPLVVILLKVCGVSSVLVTVVLFIIISTLVANVLYLWHEKPLTHYLNHRLFHVGYKTYVAGKQYD